MTMNKYPLKLVHAGRLLLLTRRNLPTFGAWYVDAAVGAYHHAVLGEVEGTPAGVRVPDLGLVALAGAKDVSPKDIVLGIVSWTDGLAEVQVIEIQKPTAQTSMHLVRERLKLTLLEWHGAFGKMKDAKGREVFVHRKGLVEGEKPVVGHTYVGVVAPSPRGGWRAEEVRRAA